MQASSQKCPSLDIESRTEETPKSLFKKFYEQACKVKWSNVLVLLTVHILAVVGYFYLCSHDIKLKTVAFASAIGLFSGLGMSVGAHRLWAHRSFKARFGLKLFLVIFQTMTMNGSALSYARDHRTHHKYSDTDADPKNPSRGL